MSNSNASQRALLVATLLVALSGCSTVKGWFAGKDAEAKKLAEPAELVDFTPTATVTKVWKANVGKGEGRIGLQQGPVVVDGRVYAAAVEGGVEALDLQTGKQIWHYEPEKVKKQPELRLSGGPGAGDGLVVIGTLDGKVIALDADTGTEKWRAEVANEVITAPAIGQGLVLVRSNDGRVSAFDAANGERRWFWNHDLPSLTVRGNAPVTLGPGVAFVGNDDGTLVALALNDGRQVWSQSIGIPEGRTELDRMSDVDGAAVLEGTTLYATSFKGETLAIEGPSGRPIWNRDNGGAGGLDLSSSLVVVSDRAGTVWGLDKASGNATWSNPILARRSLTGVTVQGDYAVVGDYDGYVHWLSLTDGQIAARERAGGERIRAKPVLADGLLLVQNVEGEITAFRVN
ncbi:outer membrane protein assembly factor BamB [Pseudoxanthomonas dokdonensis]|uniref:Outer membrane protein assembly factor BamB n=1 Tax=Pseudoxanthomonas dokdonensis TaxID=344882 RepID=A0A0R0CNJ8_9GAMM|nr:outer membrane protein assembly factor BamB [Pseudoxanthomonas dokdonensis]KRG71131.1 lipoprotein [Pseudoxanthomonas dokdonensis]